VRRALAGLKGRLLMRYSRLFRHVSLGIKSLLVHKLRSLLTMLGVVFGVGSVVAMLAVGEGAREKAMAQIVKLGAKNIILHSEQPPQQGAANSSRSLTVAYGLKYADSDRIATSYPHVEQTVPAKIARKDARVGDITKRVRIVGTIPGWFELLDDRPVIGGRTLQPKDIRTNASVCVITETVARDLLAGRNPLNATIRMAKDAYQVVGVIQSNPGQAGGMQTPDSQSDVYIPLPTFREHIGDTVVERGNGSRSRERVELHQIIAQVAERQHVEPTAAAIERMLQIQHPDGDYAMSVPLALLERARQTQQIFSIVLASIAGISLLVGGIGIMNIMLASVTERTREIGIRRAIGARQRQIVGQFLIETIVLSLAGGVMGVGLGVALPMAIERFAQMPTSVTPWSIVLSLGISASVGVLFGLYPAYRAAQLDPIVALRHE
jgi:putative ABC transport system permease protein